MKKDDILTELVAFLRKYSEIENVVLFGSRARGDFSRLSDYDIAIFGDLKKNEIVEIKDFCENDINSLLKFDIIFMNSDIISPQLCENIKKDGANIW
ncbi:MAG: nucleotidyltransferase domain-containing protein [Bacillota bacterium]